MQQGRGNRFDSGKLRYDLIPWDALDKVVEVLNAGAAKYGDRNWELGMDWAKIMAPAARHLSAMMQGEDYDKETQLLHAAHLACNALFLIRAYHSFPEMDHRKAVLTKRIGLDIDNVIADFSTAWTERFGPIDMECWNFDRHIASKFRLVENDKDFWMSIKPLISPADIPFEPCCYITSRPIPNEWSEEWLDANGFPQSPVFTVNDSKLPLVKEHCDWFVDDRYENFAELTLNGGCCFLMDAPHNQRYNVGHKRIKSLKNLIK